MDLKVTQSRGFIKFVGFLMKNPDTRRIDHHFAIDTAMNSLSRNQLVAAKNDIKELLSGSYSNEDITQIWLSCHPQFTYSGDVQRAFVQEAYDAILIALEDNTRIYVVRD